MSLVPNSTSYSDEETKAWSSGVPHPASHRPRRHTWVTLVSKLSALMLLILDCFPLFPTFK